MLQELEKNYFEAVQKLSDISGQISQAQIKLKNIQDTTDNVMSEREEQAKTKIKELIENSKDLIQEITENFDKIQHFYANIQSFTKFIEEIQEKT